MTHPLDGIAERLFRTALAQQRHGELLQCLFDGGSATVDPTGELVLIDDAAVQDLAGR